MITGASTGLGRATAEYFAQMGWNVSATMRSPEGEKELNHLQNVRVIALDVTKPDTISSAVNEAIATFGHIDVIVNNAGIGVYGALEAVTEADIDQQYAVNVRGVINVIRAILPHFRQRKSGKIINIGSVMGLSTALPLGSLYNMSKFALEGLTEGLFFELKPLNISLHLIEPGGFASQFSKHEIVRKSERITEYDLISRNVADTISASSQPGVLPPPDAIVKMIYQLATGERKDFRNVIGKDAKAVLALRKLLPIKVFLNMLTKRFNGNPKESK